jgi:hypothetical protein
VAGRKDGRNYEAAMVKVNIWLPDGDSIAGHASLESTSNYLSW